MKKINNKGFVLAETLVVSLFLLVIFTMIFRNFLPLVGEYEKREYYDDIDSKYAIFWIKRLIEDASYDVNKTDNVDLKYNANKYKFIRFECQDINDDEKKELCKKLVRILEVDGCDGDGNFCSIFITKYQIGDTDPTKTTFKTIVSPNNKAVFGRMQRYQENCDHPSISDCKDKYILRCKNSYKSLSPAEKDEYCNEDTAEKRVFSSGFEDYVFNLPDYTKTSINYAEYRVTAIFHRKKDNNNYYTYATIEVNK